jgi:hypothetical protein
MLSDVPDLLPLHGWIGVGRNYIYLLFSDAPKLLTLQRWIDVARNYIYFWIPLMIGAAVLNVIAPRIKRWRWVVHPALKRLGNFVAVVVVLAVIGGAAYVGLAPKTTAAPVPRTSGVAYLAMHPKTVEAPALAQSSTPSSNRADPFAEAKHALDHEVAKYPSITDPNGQPVPPYMGSLAIILDRAHPDQTGEQGCAEIGITASDMRKGQRKGLRVDRWAMIADKVVAEGHAATGTTKQQTRDRIVDAAGLIYAHPDWNADQDQAYVVLQCLVALDPKLLPAIKVPDWAK